MTDLMVFSSILISLSTHPSIIYISIYPLSIYHIISIYTYKYLSSLYICIYNICILYIIYHLLAYPSAFGSLYLINSLTTKSVATVYYSLMTQNSLSSSAHPIFMDLNIMAYEDVIHIINIPWILNLNGFFYIFNILSSLMPLLINHTKG